MFDNPTCPQFPARPPHGGEPFITPPVHCRKPGLPVLSVNGRVPDGRGNLAFTYIDGAEYVAGYGDPPRPALLFRQGSEVVAVVDATPLLKDGMVSSVAVSNGKLVITFNTDAGKEPVSVPLTEIFDPGTYYDKTAADGRFALKGEMSVVAGAGADADKTTITLRPGVLATVLRTHQSLDAYFNAAEYDSANQKILFKHGSVVKAQIDATAFVKDGMVSTVAISGGNLVITFNTDAGKAPVSIPLTDIFNPANYYDKTAANTLLSGKADKVANAIDGNLAALDSHGNLVDSGVAGGDVVDRTSSQQISGAKYFDRAEFSGGTGSDSHFAIWNANGAAYIIFGDMMSPNLLQLPVGSGTIARLEDIASPFSQVTQYHVDDLVLRMGTTIELYRCVDEHQGAWNSGHFTPATVEDVLSALRTAVAGKAEADAVYYTQAAQPVQDDTITLSGRTFNWVDVADYDDGDTLAVILPSELTVENGKVADVLLRIDTGASVPELSLSVVTDSFVPANANWAALEANSHNILTFTSCGTVSVGAATKRLWLAGRVSSPVEGA